MCPLRLILIFLSATLAGFFVLRNLKSELGSECPADNETHQDVKDSVKTQFSGFPNPSPGKFYKVRAAVDSGFWTIVDMASGRYLWRNMISQPSKLSD